MSKKVEPICGHLNFELRGLDPIGEGHCLDCGIRFGLTDWFRIQGFDKVVCKVILKEKDKG